jgi:subtilase family serine protease
MTDTVTNGGTGDAAASTTWYYLSLDAVHVAPGTISIGRRAVPAITAGSSNTGSQPVKVVAGTAAGTYYILACADRGYVVPESNENNNCAASTTTMVLTGPDLTENAMSVSPGSVSVNSPISVTETVTNGTMTSAGPSTTRFYLSLDTARSSNDLLMRDCNTGIDIKRAVPSLAASASSTGTTNVPLCYRDSTGIHHVATGSYFMLACADDGATVSETNEANNCASAAFTVTP